MYKISSLQEAEDLVRGATVLGTGGGGSPTEGLKLLKEALEIQGEISLFDIDELAEDSVVVSPYYIGTMAPTAKTMKSVKFEDPMSLAFQRMEKVLGKKIGAVIACEIGGANTPISINIGTKFGLPTLDGDLLGRSAPELHQCTVHLFNAPMYPSVITTETGNVVVIEKYSDIDDYEALARYISALAGRFAAVVDTPMVKELARKAAIKNTISKSIKIGRAIRESREKEKSPIEAAIEVLDGWKIFEGVVTKYNWRDEGGFLVGEVLVEGTDEWQGHRLKSWIKNEHIMAWKDGNPIVMPPDLITFLFDSGEAITNTDLKEGNKVHVVAAKAPEVWRTQKGLELFGPRHFGFNIDYVPVEKLVKS